MDKRVPSYPELGKLARDLLRRGYHPGLWQVETRSMTNAGIELFTTGYLTHDRHKVNGMVQSKYRMEDQGLTFTSGWNTDRYLFGEIMHRDKLLEGLMLALAGRYQPTLDEYDGKIRAGYVQEYFHLMGDMNLNRFNDQFGTVVGASAVALYNEFLGGVGLDFWTNDNEIRNLRFALGWRNEQATLHAEVKPDRPRSWLASLFYKFNEQIDAAVEVAQYSYMGGGAAEALANAETAEAAAQDIQAQEVSTTDTIITLGMIYHLDENSLVRAKVNTEKELGVGYEQRFGDNITASVSLVLDGNSYSDRNTRIGFGLALHC